MPSGLLLGFLDRPVLLRAAPALWGCLAPRGTILVTFSGVATYFSVDDAMMFAMLE
jgi:hypothetical protein